jgi:glyceraldehyde-3-phosphate dehydrogenase (NADP+)
MSMMGRDPRGNSGIPFNDLDRIVQTATSAFSYLSRTPLHERLSILRNVREISLRRKEEIARTISEEVYKPYPLALQEVERGALTLRLTEEEGATFRDQVLPLDRTPRGVGRHAWVRRVPLGPLLAFTPFNFPWNLAIHKVAPAIAVGCSVVLKPTPFSPKTAHLLKEVFEEGGLPPSCFQVATLPNELAEELVKREEFAIFSFTGSARVGWYLKERSRAKRVILEMGGNGASIVEEDADLDLAAERLAIGAFAYSGQVCISVQRIFVHKKIYPPFRERFLKAVENLPKDTYLCPLISEESAERVRSWIVQALEKGATILTGGLGYGREIPPTVLEGVDRSLPLFQEEVFGPVVVLDSYSTFGEALDLVNDGIYGLQASLFTKDLEKIRKAFDTVQVGTLVVNDSNTFRADEMPFGGMKRSGIGREGPLWLFYEYTEPKTLLF